MFKKFLVLIFFCFLFCQPVFAEDADSVINDLNKKISGIEDKIYTLSKQSDSLSNQLKYIDFETNITELKIKQAEDSIKTTEQEIKNISEQIKALEISLKQLNGVLSQQIVEDYKLEKRLPRIIALIQDNFNDIFKQHKYLNQAQQNSQKNIDKMETTKAAYNAQKQEKENKQIELEDLKKRLAEQKGNLESQKREKNSLLAITQNDEAKYQKLKDDAESELNALVSATFVGKKVVKKGDFLGSMGNTGYSFGAHLHFGLYNLTENRIADWKYANDIDPLDYLAKNRWPMDGMEIPIDINKECQEDYNLSSQNISRNINLGSITQCRGQTRYSYAMYSNHFHNGLDLISPKTAIYAINDGVAYFFRNPKSSLGNHVKLFHTDGKMTLYLHMQ